MPIIKILPEQLINQIAAGEVVERPASIVKELVENSLDAGAKRITIEVKDGGESFLRITDDGSGMDKEDAVLTFERHATSKISTNEDLFKIQTLGFRGEAIASIASVAYVTLQTTKRGALEGTLVIAEGGKLTKIKPIGAPEGTQIEVKQLFFNTPARRKYLKNSATEYGHILNTITGIALSFPEVAFRFIHDDKVVFDLPATDDDLTRIRSLLGKNIADELVPVFYGHSQIQLKGFIGKPIVARANRNSQYFFVNRREVKSHVLAYAVKQSYHSLLPKEKYPVFLLYFNLDPALVDVNVHPRKSEVRFADEKQIFKVVMQACEKALENHVLAPRVNEETPTNYYALRQHQMPLKLEDRDMAPSTYPQQDSAQPVLQDAKPVAATVSDALHFTEKMSTKNAEFFQIPAVESLFIENNESDFNTSKFVSSSNSTSSFVERNKTEEILPLTQLARSYILCQQGQSLVIVDQHAAHERIRYTEIIEEFEQKEKAVQPLLTPFQLELSYKELEILSQNQEILQGMGFELEPFGGNTFSIHAVPAYLVKENLEQTVSGLLDDLNDQVGKGDFQQRKEKALKYMACRSAVKFGDPLSTEEQKALLKKLQSLALPYTCPHGRPTMITMSFDELQKRFGRKY